MKKFNKENVKLEMLQLATSYTKLVEYKEALIDYNKAVIELQELQDDYDWNLANEDEDTDLDQLLIDFENESATAEDVIMRFERDFTEFTYNEWEVSDIYDAKLEAIVELVEGYSFKKHYSNGSSVYYTFELPTQLDIDNEYEYTTFKLRVSDHAQRYDADLSIDPTGCDATDLVNELLNLRCEFSENN